MFTKKQMVEYSSMPIEDGNQELKEFYIKNFDFFGSCSVRDFENYVLVVGKLAEKLHIVLRYCDEDWKIYAFEMGVTSNDDIDSIALKADTCRVLPLYVTMTLVLQQMNGKLANIIKALLNLQRYDALEYLRPHVQKLLDKRNSSEQRELTSNSRILFLENKLENVSILSSENLEKQFSLALRSELSTNHPEYEVDSLQNNMCSKSSIYESKSLPCLKSSKQNWEELPSQVVNVIPSAPLEDRVSVFIQHTEHDIDIAKELSSRMKSIGFAVKTSYEVEMLVMMDSTGAMSTILQEVDFVVPVVSKQFLQQIHLHMQKIYTEPSLDALNNRTLYQLIKTKYESNRSVNFKVRAVLLPDLKRELLTDDVVLFYGLRLWEEFPKLVRILKETKDLIQKYSLN